MIGGIGFAELILILMVLLLLIVPFLIVGLVLYFLIKVITRKEVEAKFEEVSGKTETVAEFESETYSEK